MHPAIHIFSLISIVSLTLGSLTGCGEKRVHVATVSGAPGEETVTLRPIDEAATTDPSGLSEASIDESALSGLDAAAEELLTEPEPSAMIIEPTNLAHEPSVLPNQDGSSDSFLPDSLTSAQESGFPSHAGSFSPLRAGQDFAAQSSSSPLAQNSSTELDDTLSGEGGEPVSDIFQIAKAEPSDSLKDQMNRIKEEEFATAAAGLEDVFFQFDSWTLTQEGKQSLERTLEWFEQDPSSNLTIAGHADQRGTQAYNMVLAKKRAVAVQDYLSQLGVDASRLAVISYGKDKPFCQDATEVCHQLNRRGHLLVR
jgi:peptidoglycan-associated lipoprotein